MGRAGECTHADILAELEPELAASYARASGAVQQGARYGGGGDGLRERYTALDALMRVGKCILVGE